MTRQPTRTNGPRTSLDLRGMETVYCSAMPTMQFTMLVLLWNYYISAVFHRARAVRRSCGSSRASS